MKDFPYKFQAFIDKFYRKILRKKLKILIGKNSLKFFQIRNESFEAHLPNQFAKPILDQREKFDEYKKNTRSVLK